jgi:O-antigen/teichoic acid export membrane protein
MQIIRNNRKPLVNFSTYFLSSVLNRVLPFLLLPILTRYLTPSDYGQWSIFQVLVAFVTPVICMQMHTNITRNFYRRNQDEVARIMSNILLILFINSTGSLLLIGLFASQVSTFQSIPSVWLLTLPIFAATDLFFQLNVTVLRNQERALPYSAFQIISTFLNLTFTIFLVIIFHLNWEGRVLGWLLETTILGVVSLLAIYRSGYLIPDINKTELRQILTVSLPFIPYALSAVVTGLSDRLFINHLVGTSSVGIYSIGYQFGMMMGLITDSLALVWTPWIYRQLANVNYSRKLQIVRFSYLYSGALVVLALGITFLAPILIRLFTSAEYEGAHEYVFWVALGYAFRGMYMVVFPYFVHEAKTGILSLIYIIGAIVNIVGNYVLISQNGALGGAQATLLSFALIFLATWWYSNRVYPMPWFLGLRSKMELESR